MQMQFQSRSGFLMRCDIMFSPISLNSLTEKQIARTSSGRVLLRCTTFLTDARSND